MIDNDIKDMTLENTQMMYSHIKVDRDGWRDMFWKEFDLSRKLVWTIILMTIPTVVCIVNGVLWIYRHMQVHFS